MAGPAQPPPQPNPLVHSLVPLAAVHPVRVASHSSLHSLVGFALSHLGTPSCPPLVLHTLPPPSTAAPTDPPPLDPAVAALPKLVSLHQLVLRSSPAPLHSYTLVDSFERHAIASSAPPTTADEHEQMRQDLVALDWLSGRAGSNRRPRRKHTPLMLIVVSPTPLDLPSSFTHQPPPPLSRNAKRALKRPAPAPPPPAPPPPAPQAAAGAGPGDAAPDADTEEGEERTGAGAAAGSGASEGAADPARKRRRRRRGKGGGGGGGGAGAAAAQGASTGEGQGEREGEGGAAGGMDVDAAAGA